jgi:hypothetical protein
MPFKSQAQRMACWTRYNRDIKNGKKSAWNCPKWEKETPKDHLPYKVHMPNGALAQLFQHDLLHYSLCDLYLLAKYYQIPNLLKKDDLAWVLAIIISNG